MQQIEDGFDFQNGPADMILGNMWSGVNNAADVFIDSTTYRVSGKSLGLNPGGGMYRNVVGNPGLPSTIIVASALTYTAGAAPEVQLWNAANQTGINVTMTVDQINNRLQVRAGGNNGTVLLSTDNNSCPPQTWTQFELKILFSATVGTVTLNLFGGTGGADPLSKTYTATNQNTAPSGTTCGCVTLQNDISASQPCWFDDHYQWDTSGSACNAMVNADVIMEALFVTANVSVQFTPHGAGANYQCVDETTMDFDSTYNSSTTVGQTDTFNHGALSSTPTGIFDVGVISAVRQETGSTRAVKNIIGSSGTPFNGTPVVPGTSYQYQADYSGPNDPHTAAAWTAGGVNAAQPSYQVTA